MASSSFARTLLRSALCVAALAGLGITTASAQPRSRIAEAITGSHSVAMAHSIHPLAKLGTDLGPTAGDRMLRGMSIRFNLTDAQQAALDQLLSDQQNPSSPRYQQWLTPAQYAAQFGMPAGDLAKVSAWLTAQGFTVRTVANGGTFITFDGTVAQVQRAFATNIHALSVNGETHFANIADVSVPSAFAGSVAAVTGLHDFRLKPSVRAGAVTPYFTSAISGSHFIAPGDLYTIYGMNTLLASYTGTGITIAVTGQVDINAADISAFRSASGLSTTNPAVTVHAGADPGSPSCGNNNCSPGQDDLNEASLDVEWAGAMAPAATIDFVTGVDVFLNSLTYAIDNNLAPIVTTSYGQCEPLAGSSEMVSLNTLFKQANAQGQTILAAAGDYGAAACNASAPATHGLAASFPGTSPYVTSMGGTVFNDGNTTGTTNYWSSSNGTVGQGSAASYIPEAAWNDETLGYYGGTGGGASAFFTKPVWQIGTGVPADGSRDVPDIALDASDLHDSLLFCVNVASGASCGSGFRVSTTNTTLYAGGGTSFDAQIFGGMLALIEQKIGHRVGNANPTIYALANNASYYTPGATIATNSNVVFNDVTTGNNSQPCLAGSPNCGNGGVIGFNAGTGYDQATGWGSVNVTNLANAWSLVTPLGVGSLGSNTSVTTLSASQSSVTAGSTVTLTATVTGSGAAPTGTVQFFGNGVALAGPVAVSSGTATYAWVTSCSALGQQVLSASYSGDVNYQGSKGPVLAAGGGTNAVPVEVQVSGSSCPDFALSSSTPSVSVAAGGTIPSVVITATPSNGFTGMVTFSAVSISSTGVAPTFSFSPATVNITSSAAATTTLTLSGITAALRMPTAPSVVKTPWYVAGSGVTLASLFLLLLPGRRRLSGLLLALLAVVLIGGATGCGSSQSAPPSTPTTNTYIVTVTGTYTSSPGNQITQHTTTVTYSIQ